jgi:hypothetical protein
MESTPTTTNRTAVRQAHRQKARTQRFAAMVVAATLIVAAGGVAAFVLLGRRWHARASRALQRTPRFIVSAQARKQSQPRQPQ